MILGDSTKMKKRGFFLPLSIPLSEVFALPNTVGTDNMQKAHAYVYHQILVNMSHIHPMDLPRAYIRQNTVGYNTPHREHLPYCIVKDCICKVAKFTDSRRQASVNAL